jgi:hypothetical protein
MLIPASRPGIAAELAEAFIASATGDKLIICCHRETLGSYRDCPGTTLVLCPKTLGRGSFDRVV